MLDEAHYFVSGFIKGPLCRGSIALSVIDDYLWVLFMDPATSYLSQDSAFLARVSMGKKYFNLDKMQYFAKICQNCIKYESNLSKLADSADSIA